MDFSNATILCLGDVMLDRFAYCETERISPEAPVPVIHLRTSKSMLGGAGNVAHNIASLGGLYPGGSSIAYSASKAGLIHLTRCLAVALAPDVTVNCIAPGLVEGTRMAQRLPEEVVRLARSQVVLGRTASVQDIAAQVVTFCRAESITGQIAVIDGGMPGGMR